MSAEDRVRAVLMRAAKRFESAWRAAYQGKAGDDWHVAARRDIDQAVAEARQLMLQHAQELGSTAALFEKTRIAKLYEEYENAVHRVRMTRMPEPDESPEEEKLGRAQDLIHDLRREAELLRKRLQPEALLEPVRAMCQRAEEAIARLELAEEAHFRALIGDLRSSLEHGVQQLLEDRKAGWDQPARYTKITAADLDGLAVPGDTSREGLSFDCFEDGQVRCITLWKDGAAEATLKLWPGQARARYEDSANVAEFLPSGVVEEFGGRYEREVLARKTFRQWVLDRLAEMNG